MKYVAYTIKGVEKIAVEEIKDTIKGVKILEISDKYVLFETNSNLDDLVQLKTVDDIALFLTEIEKPKKLTEEDIANKLVEADLSNFYNLLSKYRKLSNNFSFTLSTKSLRLNKAKLQDLLVGRVESVLKFNYSPLDHTNFDIRVFLNRKGGFISVRVTKDPLYKRPYKTENSQGSLKPTIAASMLRVLDLKKGGRVVDNFSGSGTILCEAHLLGLNVFGGDIKKVNTIKTRANLKNCEYKDFENIKTQDATNTKWQDNYFDYAVSNLPWDKQIGVESITNLYINTLKEYKRILKDEARLCLLVHKPQILIKHVKKAFPHSFITSRQVHFLGQSPTIVTVKSNN